MHFSSFLKQLFLIATVAGISFTTDMAYAFHPTDSCEMNSCCDSFSFPFLVDATVAYDYFRSIPDGSYPGNVGAYLSLNAGTELPFCSRWGMRFQIGGSYGVYDWEGNPALNIDSIQQQGIITTGLYRKTNCESGLNVGVVYDWMNNTHAGTFMANTSFDQIRYKLGYLFCGSNEFGFWGANYLRTSRVESFGLPLSFRAISQASLFWRHYFCTGAWTELWVGIPYSRSLFFDSGRSGQYTVGGSFRVPLSCGFSLDGHAMYMGSRDSRPFVRNSNNGSNICIGLTYTFGGFCDDAHCWELTPYLPVADNSTFIVDTNNHL